VSRLLPLLLPFTPSDSRNPCTIFKYHYRIYISLSPRSLHPVNGHLGDPTVTVLVPQHVTAGAAMAYSTPYHTINIG
jgi:hypothetical protein